MGGWGVGGSRYSISCSRGAFIYCPGGIFILSSVGVPVYS